MSADRARLEADIETCIGSGICVLTSPELFDQDDVEGRVVLLQDYPSKTQLQDAENAVAQCPSGALSLSPGEFADD